jgi:NAD(P)-dependent dehydrogenase (short-subunit alcohol dehydrogenase family)
MSGGKNPIVVVTGGNRGIGFEICRQLAERGAQVVLTARKPEAGPAALSKLASQKLSAQFHSLNVTEPPSVAELRDFLDRTLTVSTCRLKMPASSPTKKPPDSRLSSQLCEPRWRQILRDRKVIAW